MILSDYDLENMIRTARLEIKPFKKDIIRENGVDFRLDNQVARHNKKLGESFVLDPSNEEHVKKEYVLEKNKKEIIIYPHEQVLMSKIRTRIGITHSVECSIKYYMCKS